MFDLTSSKLLILGVVALLVVGPKDLPMLLRTLGKYVGIIRRHAAEFRTQFDEAMRDTELDQIRKDVAAIKSDAEGALREVTRTVDTHVNEARLEVEKAAQAVDDKPAADKPTAERPTADRLDVDKPADAAPALEAPGDATPDLGIAPAPIEVGALSPVEADLAHATTPAAGSGLNGAHPQAEPAGKAEGQPT